MNSSFSDLVKGFCDLTVNDLAMHDSRINYAMHDLHINYIFLCVSWTGWCECKQTKLHRKVKRFYSITRTEIDSFIKQTADQIKRNFFPPMHSLFCYHSHPGFLEIWFMQSTVKLDILPREVFINMNCVALT